MSKKQFASLVTCWLGLTIFSSIAHAEQFPHDFGTLSLQSTPKKIAVLNWTQAEFLLSLGIRPVAVTTAKGYRKWQSNNPPLPENIIELGHRAEPSFEALQALQPDLILGYNWRHGRIFPRLQQIAPTALYKQYPSVEDPRNYLNRMRDNYLSVSRIVGKTIEAKAQLKKMDQAFAQARTRIKNSGLSGQKVLVGKFVGMGLGLRVFGQGSLAQGVLEQLGMQNAWQRTLPGRDFSHIDLLQMPLVGNAHLILIGDANQARGMTESRVWQQLPSVRQNRIYRLPQLWSYGGPIAATRMAEIITRQLTESTPNVSQVK